MAQSSRAGLRSALETLKTLLAPASGRHSARRRRSTRVRRYAPLPAPEQATAPPELPEPPVPGSRPAPPSVHVRADRVALVRPYYVAFERELAYTRAHPARRLRARTTRPTVAVAPATKRANAYTLRHAAPRVPVPRPAPDSDLLAAPAPRAPGEFDELASLVRTWHAQRGEVVA
ncbi:hypothetical protein BJF83_05195 [Nocardiopsis sp. CNR-923]|uniref:hypothetical protein n=1 Tax=Nocardiopsis sp. CNR-923 TaxID=1904965 RepID=UPI0009665C1C|nr:hypothetical protein [Nocardiopsis sp. CNR-923]OLT25562.1 hypothetical protein BJF83_05195 [Nocardiopsis sp. CNR-923]